MTTRAWRRLLSGHGAPSSQRTDVNGRAPPPRLTVAGAWLLVYAGVVLSGQRFSTAFAHDGFQMAPYDLLSSRPLTTSMHVHVQPPLWNLVVGAIARWSPLPDALSFQAVMCLIGLAAALLATQLLMRCGTSRTVAIVGGLVAGLWPTAYPNVFSLLYELPTASLLLAFVYVVATTHPAWTTGRYVLALGLAAAVVLVRAVYHPTLLLAVILGLGYLARDRLPMRRLALAALLPAVLVGGTVVKNQVLTGEATLSSWSGMNLLRSVQLAVPQHELDALVADGTLSPVARTPPFSPYEQYADAMPPCDPAGRPELLRTEHAAEPRYSEMTGAVHDIPNFNYACFLAVYEQARDDAVALIRARPGVWLHARVAATRAWFTDYPPVDEPVGVVSGVSSRLSVGTLRLDTSSWSSPFHGELVNRPLSVLPVAMAVLLAVWMVDVVRRRRRGTTRADVVGVVTALLYAWAFAVSVVFELGEQARFRTGIDPVVAVALTVYVGTRRQRRGGDDAR